GGWLLATAGGALALAVGFAWVLLQRRRRSGKLELSSKALAPEPDARATGRALNARDLISCIAGVWLFVSPWILGNPDTAVTWFSGNNGICGALIASLRWPRITGRFQPRSWLSEWLRFGSSFRRE